MSLGDGIGYVVLAPIPLWIFLFIIYLLIMDAKYGTMCRKCSQRHYGFMCPPQHVQNKGKNMRGPLALLLGLVGIIIVIVVNFTPY